MLTTIQRSALVLHTAENMYHLVNDVDSYPLYMEGCCNAEVLARGEDYMVARLDLRKRGVSYSFTTHNQLAPYDKITLDLKSGPFKQLHGWWSFKPLSESACKVNFYLEFEPNSQLVGIAAASLFTGIANNLVNAISARADSLYGKSYE